MYNDVQLAIFICRVPWTVTCVRGIPIHWRMAWVKPVKNVIRYALVAE